MTMFFAIIGLIAVVYIAIGTSIDILSFDQTKGGYQYPYKGWTGKPVDWNSMDKTSEGLVKRGYVIDVFINGKSGLISFGILKKRFDWQTFSNRALIVHQPREGLRRRGFDPEF
ncbi:MAG: hypothetical protein JXQ96_21570 [Cyclobacteriaceae bacterium]